MKRISLLLLSFHLFLSSEPIYGDGTALFRPAQQKPPHSVYQMVQEKPPLQKDNELPSPLATIPQESPLPCDPPVMLEGPPCVDEGDIFEMPMEFSESPVILEGESGMVIDAEPGLLYEEIPCYDPSLIFEEGYPPMQPPYVIYEAPIEYRPITPFKMGFWQRCSRLLKGFYLGFEGGFVTGLSSSKRNVGSGPVATAPTAISYGLNIQGGYHLGANLGCIISPCLRTDLSYTYLRVPVKWQNQISGAAPFSLSAHLHSHLVLWNGYLHLNDFCNFCVGFSPYLAGGVGVAFNNLGAIRELNASGQPFARSQGHTAKHFGARFGLGLLKPFCRCWALDTGFYINYLGVIESGNRQRLESGTSQEISPYHHSNNWVGTFYLGIKYRM